MSQNLNNDALSPTLEEKRHAKSFYEQSFLKCQNATTTVLKDEKVIFLLSEIEAMGCKPPLIHCTGCVEEDGRMKNHSAGYRPIKNDVILCHDLLGISNKLVSNYKVYRGALMHELIHAYDQCRLKGGIDYDDERHVACTEIRASNLSGECNLLDELGRFRLNGFYSHYQDCVRRRASLSLQEAFPRLQNPDEIIDSLWHSCYHDKEPFRYFPYREL